MNLLQATSDQGLGMESDSVSWKMVDVLLPIAVNMPFTYCVPPEITLEPGDFVHVPFRKGTQTGVVWSDIKVVYTPPEATYRTIQNVLDLPTLPVPIHKFISWLSAYTLSPLGTVLKMLLSIDVTKAPPSRWGYMLNPDLDLALPQREARKKVIRFFQENPKPSDRKELLLHTGVSPSALGTMVRDGILLKHIETVDNTVAAISVPELTPTQHEAVAQLMPQQVGHQVCVLDGVTGSGKTEVYFEIIEHHLRNKKQVLVLLPEISLSSAWWNRFYQRFGFYPDLWHSEVTQVKKNRIWRKALNGEAQVVVGARSSLFLPFVKLGLIVVDEEHDSSFKQEEGVLYNARDMAIVRAKIEDIPIVLSSATPSLETVENVRQGRYKQVRLAERFGGFHQPSIHLIDMRQVPHAGKQWLSPQLRDAVRTTLNHGEQTLVYINRRGYAPVTVCRACGHRMMCTACHAWLVAHDKASRLLCHHCGYAPAWPTTCPDCGAEDKLLPCGPGVERVAEEVKNTFPEARILIMSSDSLSSFSKLQEAMLQIQQGDVDIIVGTQIMAKGHDFPKLTCVGVVDADLGLMGSDLRASERTFQVLTQVAGRAGRHRGDATVYLQTFDPQNPLMQALQHYDRDAFLEHERTTRESFGFPPYGRLAGIIFSGLVEHQVERVARAAIQRAHSIEGIEILGPVPAPLSKVRGRYRWRALIKGTRQVSLQGWISKWLGSLPALKDVRIQVDIDPLTFL